MSPTLIALRVQRRLSQAQLAALAGVSQPQVSRIERGLTSSAIVLNRLLTALQATHEERSAALAELGTVTFRSGQGVPVVDDAATAA
jgi:transcriptional regulator with XRE-family HTH domain